MFLLLIVLAISVSHSANVTVMLPLVLRLVHDVTKPYHTVQFVIQFIITHETIAFQQQAFTEKCTLIF